MRPRKTSASRFVVVAALVGLALLCLVMAWQHYGIETAQFDADPTRPAQAGAESAGGLDAEGVRWLIAASVGLVAAVVVALRKR